MHSVCSSSWRKFFSFEYVEATWRANEYRSLVHDRLKKKTTKRSKPYLRQRKMAIKSGRDPAQSAGHVFSYLDLDALVFHRQARNSMFMKWLLAWWECGCIQCVCVHVCSNNYDLPQQRRRLEGILQTFCHGIFFFLRWAGSARRC